MVVETVVQSSYYLIFEIYPFIIILLFGHTIVLLSIVLYFMDLQNILLTAYNYIFNRFKVIIKIEIYLLFVFFCFNIFG